MVLVVRGCSQVLPQERAVQQVFQQRLQSALLHYAVLRLLYKVPANAWDASDMADEGIAPLPTHGMPTHCW